MVKEERIVMLVSRLIVFPFLIWFIPAISFSQPEKAWGVVLAPGASNQKLPHGVGIVYPDSPFFVNLKIREPDKFAFRAEIMKERTNKKNWYFANGFGFSTFGYMIYYDYDREASIGTIRSEGQDFYFIFGSYKVGRTFRINRFGFTPYAGASLNYAIRDKTTYYVGTYLGTQKSVQYNQLEGSDRWTLGWELGTRLSFKVNDKFELGLLPSFSKIQKSYSLNGERKVYSWNLGFAVVKKVKR